MNREEIKKAVADAVVSLDCMSKAGTGHGEVCSVPVFSDILKV